MKRKYPSIVTILRELVNEDRKKWKEQLGGNRHYHPIKQI